MFHHFDRFLAEYEGRFGQEYGYLRPITKEVVERYLDCGNPRCGFWPASGNSQLSLTSFRAVIYTSSRWLEGKISTKTLTQLSDLSRRLRDALSGRYRIERELGRGGMATVFLAEDLKHHRRVAIKVFDPEVAAAIGSERFQREIEIVARLTHPHILPLHDSGVAEGFLFYVMPYVEGESLRDRLTREKQLPLEDALCIAREVADALDYAHRHRVVHRDIKPENILLEEGHAVVADFGIARAVAAAGEEKLTATGLVVGTPAYMSPEQAAGSRDVAGRSDLYSLGCVLYEMLAGQPPFIGPTLESLVHQHLNLEPRPVSALRSSVPQAVDRALARALAKTPADRFVTVAEFAAALEAGGVGARTGTGPRTITAAAGPALRSLAVLPLENLSGDPRQEYFADGMTEALIAILCRISALRVISRTSVMTYKGARKPLPAIARELNVDAIMEGTVMPVGDEVRITAQLISTRDDALLWSESFDRHLCDVLSLQGEVARAIAAAVRVELSRAERSLLGIRRQVDPEVYRRELMGRQAMAQRKMEGFRLAVEHFRQAIALDSTYAPVHAGLSEALMLLSNYGIEPPRATHQPARDAAERALELDPALYEGHVSLAAILWQYEWDWDRAEHQIQRAIELNPGAANARHWHSAFLAVAGRFEEALAENHRAQELDPLSQIFVAFEGWIMAFEGRDREAMARLRYAIELDPLYVPALFYLGLSLTRVGRGDDAIEAIEQAVQLSGRLARTLTYLVFACARAGRRERAMEVLAELEERARTSYVPPYFLATAHGALGHLDRAMEWLERGYMERDVMMRDLAVDPASEPLRQDERGRDVLRRMGLAR